MLPLTAATAIWLLLAAGGTCAQNTSTMLLPPPPPPGLAFLLSCNITMGLSIKVGTGVLNMTRAVFPIFGGAAAGRVTGKILEVGADWAAYGTLLDGTNVAGNSALSADPRATPYFATDARFQLRTLDGADVQVETRGQTAPDSADGSVAHVRAQFQTGSAAYAWLNDVLAVGMLHTNSDGYRIDLWEVTTPT